MSIFQSFSNLTPLEKLVAGINATTAGYQVAKSLVSSGSASSTATNTGIQKNDNVSSPSSNEFFLGTVPERATASAMAALRFVENGLSFSQNFAPENVVSAVSEQGKGGAKVYPPDLKADFRMTFNFFDYVRPNPFSAPKLTAKDTIVLPLPQPLSERHDMEWAESKTGVFGEIFDALLVNQGQQGNAAESAAARAAPKTALEAIGRARLGKFALAHILPGDIDKQVEQSVGAILNPHLTQFFEGPTFQNYQFQWRFHPRTASESELIRDICVAFKKHSLPSRTVKDLNSFLSYPSIVEVKLDEKKSTETFLFPMKRCVIASVNIDYAPMGVLAFFKGTKAPRVIDFTINLKAIEFFLSEDFGGSTTYKDESGFINSVNTTFDGAFDAGKSLAKDIFNEGKDLLFGGE